MLGDKFLRVWSIAKKEFIQIRRDKVVFLWLLFAPAMQILLFGFIINTDPKHLPTTIISSEDTPFTRSLLQGLKNTHYFSIDTVAKDEKSAERLLLSGKSLFIINIPPNFSRDLLREKYPHVLIEADASDPLTVANAFRAASELPSRVFEHDLHGALEYLAPKEEIPFEF